MGFLLRFKKRAALTARRFEPNLATRRRVHIAVDERFWTIDGQSKTLFCEDGDEVLDEVVFVLGCDFDASLPAVENLRTQLECTGEELACGHGLGRDNRQTPEGRSNRSLRVADDVTALGVLQEFDRSPVNRAEDVTRCRIFSQSGLKHRHTKAVNTGHSGGHGRASRDCKGRCLRDDAEQVLAGAIAIEKLVLFDIGQTVQQTLIDDRTKLGNVGQHLTGCLHPVCDDLGRGRDQFKLDVRTGLCSTFSHRSSVVVEALFLDVFQRTAVHLALRKQVTDRKTALRQFKDARKASGLDCSANGTGGVRGCRGQRGLGLNVDATARVRLTEKFLDLVVFNELFANGLFTLTFATGTGRLLLELVKAGLEFVHGEQIFVGLFLQAFAEVAVLLGFRHGLFSDFLHGVELLLEVGLDLQSKLLCCFHFTHGNVLSGQRGLDLTAQRSQEGGCVICLFALWLTQSGLRIANRGNLCSHAFWNPCLTQDVLKLFDRHGIAIAQTAGELFHAFRFHCLDTGAAIGRE
nr:MAG TPA: hypothetical protein [Caudoviricetes sp.]